MTVALRYISAYISSTCAELENKATESASAPVTEQKQRKGNRTNNVKHVWEEF